MFPVLVVVVGKVCYDGEQHKARQDVDDVDGQQEPLRGAALGHEVRLQDALPFSVAANQRVVQKDEHVVVNKLLQQQLCIRQKKDEHVVVNKLLQQQLHISRTFGLC